jgi:hypothetical protein
VGLLVKPEQCRRCRQPPQGKAPQPQGHQVTEMPPVKPVITEYRVHRLGSPACGEATRAARPAGVPLWGVGPRVQASTILGTGPDHRSLRTTPSVLPDLFGVPGGMGRLSNLEHATGRAAAEAVAAPRAYSPSPSGRGRGEGWAGPGRTLAGPRLPDADLQTALGIGTTGSSPPFVGGDTAYSACSSTVYGPDGAYRLWRSCRNTREGL